MRSVITPLVLLLLIAGMLSQPALAARTLAFPHGAAPAPVSRLPSRQPPPADDSLGVEAFLAAQPGPLKSYREGGQTAAAIIGGNSLYYGLSPRLHLALLETVSELLSNPSPAASALQRPFGASGPEGFAAQVEWASRELRAGLGPYERPPIVRFSDGVTLTLSLEQAPEGVAVQRFLAIGRGSAEWRALVDRFAQVLKDYFNNELPAIGDLLLAPGHDAPAAGSQAGIALLQPWPAGARMVHLAYFDHIYPTVDVGDDGNGHVVNYRGRSTVQYDGHDGHDYFFPDQPIGTPILAAAAGVAFARTQRGNGVVIIHPGGYETVYWHLSSFAPIFAGRVDSNAGVWVEAGALLGASGRSGFVGGTPHLHFEVRHYGRQVDPYGWQGPGSDPCTGYAGCAESTWLWHPALAGTYDFTPAAAENKEQRAEPALSVAEGNREQRTENSAASSCSLFSVPCSTQDVTLPVGTFAVAPPPDLLLLARFDGSPLQTVGQGFPALDGELTYGEGRFGQSLRLPADGGLTFPISENLDLDAGTISMWALLPERYSAGGNGRHYLFAASASPEDDARIYSGTLALRREAGPDGAPRWNFWTTPASGEADRDDLTAPDTLGAGWRHIAVTWDTRGGRKALYLDGALAAERAAVSLPEDVGRLLQIGRFTFGGRTIGAAFDELAVFRRALAPAEIAALAAATAPLPASSAVVSQPVVFVDTNAFDDEGGIVAVQLGRDGVFEDPQPYYDRFRWSLPPVEGRYDLAVRYFDRASNSTTLTETVTLDMAPRGSAALLGADALGATLAISVTDAHPPLSVQISQRADFAGAGWQPLRPVLPWTWQREGPRQLFVRFRDAGGNISEALQVMPAWRIYLPVVGR